ncbi:hypothetical protein WJX81_005056 [Elliptochloris bilobata]|uniref:Uncharacterized protein n=1 Tax=Elliptochloris bilobata TaxID=381761 RepID=A0AAW1RFB6_9CHLO
MQTDHLRLRKGPSLQRRRSMGRVACALGWALAAACLCAACGQQLQPGTYPAVDPALFAPVQVVGAPTGLDNSLLGCARNGATLKELKVWAFSDFIRGLEATLTDGRQAASGCVNTTTGRPCSAQDQGTGDTVESFEFQPGERLTALWLWSGPSGAGVPNYRAGAIRLSTSLGRTKDFGNNKDRANPVIVDTASGIPCGVVAKDGNDVDAIGIVFLQTPAAAVLDGVAYPGLPTSQVTGPVGASVALDEADLRNVTLDNTAGAAPAVCAYASDLPQNQSAAWAPGAGLDAYFGSNATLPDALVPQLSTGGAGHDDALLGWAVQHNGTRPRASSGIGMQHWNYSLPVAAGASVGVLVTAVSAWIEVPYTANLTLVLPSGANLTVPVKGTYRGSSYSPVWVHTEDLVLPPVTLQSSDFQEPESGKRRRLVAILGGVLGSLVALQLFLALLALYMGGKCGGGGLCGKGAADEEAGAGGGEDGVEFVRAPSRRGSRVLKAHTPRAQQGSPGAPGDAAPNVSPLRALRLGSLRHALSGWRQDEDLEAAGRG